MACRAAVKVHPIYWFDAAVTLSSKVPAEKVAAVSTGTKVLQGGENVCDWPMTGRRGLTRRYAAIFSRFHFKAGTIFAHSLRSASTNARRNFIDTSRE